MKTFEIIIENKIARAADKAAYLVCGNSDYTIKFSFDEEWAEHDAKTARFTHNGKYTDVVFTGDECPVPALYNTTLVSIGVFAGDLRTTTPATIPCERSILCGGGTPAAPTPDVYSQIMQMINAGILKGEAILYCKSVVGIIGKTYLVALSDFEGTPRVGDLVVTGNHNLARVESKFEEGVNIRILLDLKGANYVLTDEDKTEIKNGVLADLPFYDGAITVIEDDTQ